MTYYEFQDFDSYQELARRFACYNDPLYPFLGLAEEAGEVCGKIAKHLRGDKGAVLDKEPVIKELGDVLWMVSQCCEELDISMSIVASENLEKLTKRQMEGKIKGDGDDR